MKFNIDNYKGKYVMHCKTEEEAKIFCKYLHSIGRMWNNGNFIFQKAIGMSIKNQCVIVLMMVLIVINIVLKKEDIPFSKWRIL